MENQIKFKGNNNPKLESKDGEILKFCYSIEDLEDPDIFNSFIKATEKLVRTDPRYDNYISYLKNLGYTKDVFQAGIDSNVFLNTKIEMHHGPMFTLYDICGIVTDHFLADDIKVNTFMIANEVLCAHERGHIQLVMGLTETNHQLCHSGKLFVHMNQTIGDIMAFIKDYKNGFRKEHLYTLGEYIKMCDLYDATDNDYLTLRCVAEKLTK